VEIILVPCLGLCTYLNQWPVINCNDLWNHPRVYFKYNCNRSS